MPKISMKTGLGIFRGFLQISFKNFYCFSEILEKLRFKTPSDGCLPILKC